MTTSVTIYAGHGVAVDLIAVTAEGESLIERVPAGETRSTCAWEGRDIVIREVKPDAG